MEYANSENVSQQGSPPHMGLLRCQIDSHGRKMLKGYKKRFWVVNERAGFLAVYKNDQEPLPQQTFPASDLRGVMFADDKQDRFVVMIVKTRSSRTIKFRMSSFEEREAWSTAISRLMDTHSMINRHKSVLSMILRRVNTVSKKLNVNITVDTVQLLNEVSDDLLQYVPEAVDIGLSSVTAIVRALSEESIDMPRSYTLNIHAVTSDSATQPQHSRGATYNPLSRTIVLSVSICKGRQDRVHFTVTHPEEVFQLVRSNVFRDPLIEGWIDAQPGCAEACGTIQHQLGVSPVRHNWITFQWGQHLSDSVKVEAYLQRFITARFFEDILNSVKRTIAEVKRLITNTAATKGTGASVGAAAGAGGGHTAAAAQGPRRIAPAAAEMHPAATSLLHTRISSTLLGASINATSVRLLPPALDPLAASHLISDNINGLCIQLEKKAVENGRMPPAVTAVRSSEYEQQCRPAFLLVTKFRKVFLRQRHSFHNPLVNELYEVAYHAFLQQQVSLLRSELNSIFHRRIGVVVLWDRLFKSIAAQHVELGLSELPHLVRIVKEVCLSRLHHLSHILSHSTMEVAEQQMEDMTLFQTFCTCIQTIVVDFLPFTGNSFSVEATVQTPSVRCGALTDTLYCSPENLTADLMAILRHQPRGTQPSRSAIPIGHNICLYAAEPKLGAWCEHYFSNPENTVPDSRRFVIEDEFDSDSDAMSIGTLDQVDFGEAVAYERSAETQLLTIQRVVNIIYDSQRNSPIDLKIGSGDIVLAIRSFVKVFGDQSPSKRDVARVLSVNLQRLRQMYVRAVDDETTSLLTFEQARQLLRDFCEYEMNEKFIEPALQNVLLSMDYPAPSTGAAVASTDHRSRDASPRRTIGGPGRVSSPQGEASAAAPTNRQLSEGLELCTVSSSSVSDHDAVPHEFTPPAGRRMSIPRRRFSLASRANGAATTAAAPATAIASTTCTAAPEEQQQLQQTATHEPISSDDFDFPSVSFVALNVLLPREARLARMALRVGFVFGLENTGKTLLVNSMRGIARPTVATVGLSQHVVAFGEWIWGLNELGGRKSFRSNWKYYVKRVEQMDFLIFVVDILSTQELPEARRYLKEVTKYFSDVPLVVIFNNFREGHRRFDIGEYEDLLHLEKLRRSRPGKTISCVCNVTVVHSKHRRIPDTVAPALEELSDLLLKRSKDSGAATPPEPKAPVLPTNAGGNRHRRQESMQGVSNTSLFFTSVDAREYGSGATVSYRT